LVPMICTPVPCSRSVMSMPRLGFLVVDDACVRGLSFGSYLSAKRRERQGSRAQPFNRARSSADRRASRWAGR
jgi:hypothetical protein